MNSLRRAIATRPEMTAEMRSGNTKSGKDMMLMMANAGSTTCISSRLPIADMGKRARGGGREEGVRGEGQHCACCEPHGVGGSTVLAVEEAESDTWVECSLPHNPPALLRK